MTISEELCIESETSNTTEMYTNAQKLQYIKYKEQGYDRKQYELQNS